MWNRSSTKKKEGLKEEENFLVQSMFGVISVRPKELKNI